MDLLRLSCALVVLFSTTTICNAALGATCTEDSNCDDANDACTGVDGSKTCTCLPTFKKAGDNPGTCVVIALGDACTTGVECANTSNSECVGQTNAKKCNCTATHKPVDGKCVPKTVLGSTCTTNGAECEDTADSECVAGTLNCTCKTTHKPVGGKCVIKTVLGGTCTEGGKECADIAHSECVNNGGLKCTCSTTHKPVSGKCEAKTENGSRGNLASVLVVILSLATAFQF